MDRRQLKKQRSIEKNNQDIEKAKSKGRFIKENHGILPYSLEYTKEVSTNLRKRLGDNPSVNDLRNFRKLIIDLLVFWNPEYKNEDKDYFKKLIEDYWDGKY